jgi:SAM-dependent methyltransferase
LSVSPLLACRSCGATDLRPVIDLGTQPLANALRTPGDSSAEPRYRLATVFCPACALVQLDVTVPPETMFDQYNYFSSYSTTMVDEMGRLAKRMCAERELGPDQLVIEVASNDGYLLRQYLDLGVAVQGVDPARNVAEVAIETGVPTMVDYFGTETAERLRSQGMRADVLHANNVMAHVPDINDFVAGIGIVLADQGLAVVETPYVVDLIASAEFDTIYHEHVFYYSLSAVDALVRRHGLVVDDVERLPIHGGSLRLFIVAGSAAPTGRVADMLEEERRLGVAQDHYYSDFADRVDAVRRSTTALVSRLHDDGHRLAAYGAAAKGTVLLNHFGIDHRLIEFVVDRNEHKHGLLMPGVGIPIEATGRLLSDQPDDVLLLAWNFAEEIIGQQQAYLEAGGSFIVPLPELATVSA